MAKTIGDLLNNDKYDGNDFSGDEGLELWDRDKTDPDRSKGITIDQLLSSAAGDGLTTSGSALVVGSSVARTNVNETFNNDVYVSGGDVGIGTNSPGQKLEVEGKIRTSESDGGVQFKPRDGTGQTFEWYNPGNDDLRLFASSNLLTIKKNGNVGLGNTSPSYALDVSGTVNATDFRYTSDERLKTNLTQISDPLRRIENLTGYTFEWGEDAEVDGPAAGHSAQEVEDVLPEVVDDTQEHLSLKGNLTALHTEAIKALAQEVRELREVVHE